MANLGYIQVTRLCNQKCRFCSNPEREATLSLEQAQVMIDDFIARGYDGIILTGGEPTLHEDLDKIIAYATRRGIPARVITNGQKLIDMELLKRLYDAGLRHCHVSVQSCDEKKQGFLSSNEKSLKNILKSLENLGKLGVKVDINTTINHYNANELDKLAMFLVSRFPFITHYVWNNLDPKMNRATENPDVIPKLWEFEISLNNAMRFLHESGRTFRAERIPLCYMADFAWASTETRKIVKGEERIVRFLDEKGFVRETLFEHGKAEVCKVCRFDPICAGLYEMDVYYSSKELYPVFLDPDVVRAKILERDDT
jgi:MoaA/NifB/PqqE/SkfB family radical SAM enzyme